MEREESSVTVTTVELKREISLFRGISLIIGSMIGSGIFVVPVSILRHSESVGLALLVWTVAGINTFCTAIATCEIAAMFSKSGGYYVYIKYVFGPLCAFLYIWLILVIIQPCVIAILGLISANYLIGPIFGECSPPDYSATILSLTIAALLIGLNCTYIKYVAKAQVVFAGLKLLAVGIICITGIVQIAKGRTEHFHDAFDGSNWNPGSLALSFFSATYTYGGWSHLFTIMEELKNPTRDAPLAALMSLAGVTVIYVMTNVAYFTVLSPDEVKQAGTVALLFADRTLGPFSVCIPVMISLCTIGALNAFILESSRMSFAAARDGILPVCLGMIHVTYRTPWIGLILALILSTLYTVIGDILFLIEYTGLVARLINTIIILCVLYLRWKEPNRTRPVRSPVPLIVVVFIVNVVWVIFGVSVLPCIFQSPVPLTVVVFIVNLVWVIFGVYQAPGRSGVACLLILSGIPVYILYVKVGKKSLFWNQLEARFTLTMQKTFKVMKSA